MSDPNSTSSFFSNKTPHEPPREPCRSCAHPVVRIEMHKLGGRETTFVVRYSCSINDHAPGVFSCPDYVREIGTDDELAGYHKASKRQI